MAMTPEIIAELTRRIRDHNNYRYDSGYKFWGDELDVGYEECDPEPKNFRVIMRKDFMDFKKGKKYWAFKDEKRNKFVLKYHEERYDFDLSKEGNREFLKKWIFMV